MAELFPSPDLRRPYSSSPRVRRRQSVEAGEEPLLLWVVHLDDLQDDKPAPTTHKSSRRRRALLPREEERFVINMTSIVDSPTTI